MDLIYEGITTLQGSFQRSYMQHRQNGPDLRRDYDLSFFLCSWVNVTVRMDLIYEGITT